MVVRTDDARPRFVRQATESEIDTVEKKHEKMGHLIKNLTTESNRLGRLITKQQSDNYYNKRTIDNLETRSEKMSRMLAGLVIESEKLQAEASKSYLSKLAIEFCQATGVSTNILEAQRLISEQTLIHDCIKAKEIAIRDTTSTIETLKLKINQEKASYADGRKKIRLLQQESRQVKNQIKEVSREKSMINIIKARLLSIFDNLNGDTTIIVEYYVYNTNNFNVYRSEKAFTLINEFGKDRWYQIRPSGLKIVNSKNKISLIEKCLDKANINENS